MKDVRLLDRIDVLWSIKTKSQVTTPSGEASVKASFMLTLGTYAGEITRSIMAENLNSRGIHDGDINSVMSKDDAVTAEAAMVALQQRGIREQDIGEMVVMSVLLDEETIATSVFSIE